MKKLLTSSLCFVFVLVSAELSFGQEEEGPEPRSATVTTFEIPIQDRNKVVPYIQEHVVPYMRLNPNVVTFRVLLHNWGSNASQIIFYSEYKEFGDINADCGQPCEDYQMKHPEPEEGDEGYEEFIEVQRLFQKYYSDHHDEIYFVPMEAAKTEGKNLGPIGPPEDQNEEN